MDREDEDLELKRYNVSFYYSQEVIIPGSIEVLASSKEEAEEMVQEKHWNGELDDELEESYVSSSDFNISECQEIN